MVWLLMYYCLPKNQLQPVTELCYNGGIPNFLVPSNIYDEVFKGRGGEN